MMMTMVTEDWEALRQAVERERFAQQLDTLGAFAHAAGFAEKTARKVIAGTPVSPKTLRQVERALGWQPLSADQILRGGADAIDSQTGRPPKPSATLKIRDHDWYEEERSYVRSHYPPGNDRDWLLDKLDRDEDAIRTAAREREKLDEAWDRLGRTS